MSDTAMTVSPGRRTVRNMQSMAAMPLEKAKPCVPCSSSATVSSNIWRVGLDRRE